EIVSEELNETHTLTFAGFETKALLSPNLKTPNAYQVSVEGLETIDFKPPFLVVMSKDDSTVPYFAAVITNNQLLID
ncbi:MAG: hypothetical protein KDC92_15305, partial [Bacteroidetes bacterium]|nr:hypothetical protein [Bacteroidota bacterium]